MNELDELVALAKRLIAYDTSEPDVLHEAAGFLGGWLGARGVEATQAEISGLPVISASIGDPAAPAIILHGHLDVVPGHPDQFEPRIEGDKLIGRGAYDMKGALAGILVVAAGLVDAEGVQVRLGIVCDEESDKDEGRGSDHLVDAGFSGEFAITGEPTDLHIGVEAKGILALHLEVSGVAAHGATPWLGDNAVLKAHDVFRRIESLPFARQSSELFDRPSINLARIWGGDAFNKVPDRCVIDVDIRYLPGQDPEAILAEIAAMADVTVRPMLRRPPATVDRSLPYLLALREAVTPFHDDEPMSVGRDGASDVVSFLRVGIPSVEFGPTGGGHHGPEEWVSVSSLENYRQALDSFLRELAPGLKGAGDE